MPQADKELRDKWGGIIWDDKGNIVTELGENCACAYLEARGYLLTKDYCWIKPSRKYVPTPYELEAIAFLIDEWDWGAIYDPPGHVIMQDMLMPKG